MKVLVIYANDAKEEVTQLRQELENRFGEQTVLRLHSVGRKKSLFRHAWHRDAVRMMKLADVIVYAVSNASSTNVNVNWELKKALKLKRYIVCLPVMEGAQATNPCLAEMDEATKQERQLADPLKSKEQLFKLIESYEQDDYLQLFHEPVDQNTLLEQYKIFIESMENLTTRRQNVNSFYISANTALITVAGTVMAIGAETDWRSKLPVILALSLPGIGLNISWRKMLQSYYINNKSKMKILSMIEKRLAVSLFDAEWRAMKNKFSKKKYVSFTDNEKGLTGIFMALYFVAIAICLGVWLFPWVSGWFA